MRFISKTEGYSYALVTLYRLLSAYKARSIAGEGADDQEGLLLDAIELIKIALENHEQDPTVVVRALEPIIAITITSEFVMFDVVYEDGTQRSNRKVPRELISGADGDKPAYGFLIEQDRDIAEKSGRPLAKIKSITRSDAKKKARDAEWKKALSPAA